MAQLEHRHAGAFVVEHFFLCGFEGFKRKRRWAGIKITNAFHRK
jgi:hypothetical protein